MHTTVKFVQKSTSEFFKTLRKRVNEHFSQNEIPKTGNYKMAIKTTFMLSLYFVPYFLILSEWPAPWVMLLLCVLMGWGMAGIGFSVMHDANHGSYSRYKWLNKLMGYSITLLGGSVFNWKMQHNYLHHTYTNVYEIDEDIHDKPILRLSPYGKLKKIHRYQSWYAMLLYSLATIGWITKKDFAQLFNYNKTGLIEKSGHKPSLELIKLIGEKLFYYLYILVVPLLVLSIPWWQVVLGFIVMHLVSGVVITTVFQLAHVVDGPHHYKPPEDGNIENSWAIHQLFTTANFGTKSRIMSWFVGGLNFQIEHHLFPNICHIHYKSISKIVKKTAKEYNLPYYEFPNFFAAFVSHLKVLHRLGRGMSIA